MKQTPTCYDKLELWYWFAFFILCLLNTTVPTNKFWCSRKRAILSTICINIEHVLASISQPFQLVTPAIAHSQGRMLLSRSHSHVLQLQIANDIQVLWQLKKKGVPWITIHTQCGKVQYLVKIKLKTTITPLPFNIFPPFNKSPKRHKAFKYSWVVSS